MTVWCLRSSVVVLIALSLFADPADSEELVANIPDAPKVEGPSEVQRPRVVSAETTTASRQSAAKGTKWMLQTINRDGGCGTDVGQPSDIGCSAMVALALMSQGSTINEGPHSRELRKILNYMLRQTRQMRGDDITNQVGTQLQNKIGRHAHSFFAALFLSQVVGEDADNTEARKALHKVVTAIGRAQQSDGSWGTQSWAPTLGTVMGWVSLRGAYSAGFHVRGSADKTAEYLISQMSTLQNQGSWMHTLYKNATGVRVLYAMKKGDDARCRKAFEDVLRLVSQDSNAFRQAGGEEYLAFHLITETMLQAGGKDWDRWYPVVRDRIVSVQNADGSWTGHHCITSRTFCTAAAVLVLQSPGRMLPISNE